MVEVSTVLPVRRCPIVGIVASAGGLDAFKRFFGALPADSGLTFVLIPHLDPTHESQMVSLLSKFTPMLVVEVQQGTIVRSNHIYIIPPNKFLSIHGGELQLTTPPLERSGPTAMDFFLSSLAQDQTERAIGIVFSGTGSHGTSGIRSIKLAGGLTLAQQPESAEYDAMPRSAIDSGQIDCILPPEEMPATLMRYVEQPYLSNLDTEVPIVSETSDHLQQILTLLQSQTKYDFRSYRQAMVLRRIQRRMQLVGVADLSAYFTLLQQRSTEATALYKDLLISVTAFFRNNEAFRVLEHEIIPALIDRCAPDAAIRVWVPGCATGEEAYSIAMLLLEATAPESEDDSNDAAPVDLAVTAPAPRRIRLQIFASDLDDDAIAFARNGQYSASSVSELSTARLKRFFVASGDGSFRVTKQLRETIVFSHQNLISDAPFSNMDLISCRNVLIYLEPELQQNVISLLHFALATDGCLLLGPAESLGRTSSLFQSISKTWRIFRKTGPSNRINFALPFVPSDQRPGPGAATKVANPRGQSLKEFTETLILTEYAPAAALINRKFEILCLTGPMVNYLEFPAGELSKDLLAMVRPGLRTKLRIALNSSVRGEVTVTDADNRVKRSGHYFSCRLSVRPLRTPKEVDGMLLATFEDHPTERSQKGLETIVQKDSTKVFQGEDSDLVQQLEYELKTINTRLQTTVEEMEGSSEELKTSNEEIMSVNEELQSANEELETSKEELQSLNEELLSVNSQLNDKVMELDQAKEDLLNLMASTKIATIFLDESLEIKRFTPPTAKLLNLRPIDLGRPLSDITQRFVDAQILADCRSVLDTHQPIEREIHSDDSLFYLFRILPYRAVDQSVGGVVITFVDISHRKQVEADQREKDKLFIAALHDSTERMAAILDTAVDAIITIDRQGVIDSINRATLTLFGYEREELLGCPITRLIPSLHSASPPFDIDKYLLQQLDRKLETRRETSAMRKNGSIFPIELAFGKIDHLGLYTGILRDISERKRFQAHLLEIAAEEQTRIGQELHDGTQQELTGLTLFAGAICDLLNTAIPPRTASGRDWKIEGKVFGRLKQSTEKLLQGLKTANQHVHKLSHGIMPVQIDSEGLRSALAELATTTNELQNIRCRFACSGVSSIPNNLIATQLYRIAQESLNNALKHASPDLIEILLTQEQQQITLEIRDNGVGLDSESPRDDPIQGRGLGLRIMEYRASVLGGVLEFRNNTPGSGMTLRCMVPLNEGFR